MDERDEVESKVREAVEAAVQVYAGDRRWLDWAEAWLSKRDRTVEAALRAASLIPGTEESFAVVIKGLRKIGELHARGHETSSETYKAAVTELLGDYERRSPQSADLEAAVPRTAAESAFWSTLSACFAATGAADNAQSCAEASLTLAELLSEDDGGD
jgi:hypothetical protein